MRKLAFTLLLLFACPAWGADKPPEIASVIKANAPYGEGTYSWMLIKAYDATLWTDAQSWSMQAPFALVLHYHMHFASSDLAARSVEEMKHIAPLTQQEQDDYLRELRKLFPDVQSGDHITALYMPGKGAKIFYDGKPEGTIADDTFARRFLGIWLSAKTSAPDLRAQLLKKQ